MLEPQTELASIENPAESPIFVIGTGRSGTTLLRQMLNAHPNIYIAHESAFYSYLRLSPKRTPLQQWLRRYVDTFSFAWMLLNPAPILERVSAAWDLSAAHLAYREFLLQKATARGKKRFGDKNPLDTQNVKRIFSDFPKARVIFMVRHPVPTVASFSKMPFGASGYLTNALLCRFQCSHIKPFLDSILEVRLEDLSDKPRATMQSILNFVGEPWDDAVLEHVTRAQTDDLPPSPWFVGATVKSVGEREIESPVLLPEPWIRIIERLNRETMARYSYKPINLKQEVSVWDCVRALLSDLRPTVAGLARLQRLNNRIVRHIRGKERLPPQLAQQENLMLNPSAWKHYARIDVPSVPPVPPDPNRPFDPSVPY